jgi:uncharacterized protein YijF (DUF1287 family)
VQANRSEIANCVLLQNITTFIMIKTVIHIFVFISTISIAVGQSIFFNRLADSTLTLTKQIVRYDPAYFQLDYPNGDVPQDKGVCTDVVIRAYRKLGIDLQKEVHEDMKSNFSKYPKNWGLHKPDKNIDHRRVPNLMTFFTRFGATKPITTFSRDYKPGDIVCWNLGGSVTHIGIVVRKKSSDGQRYLIVHNIGSGQVMEDCLFSYKIIGHYRYAK